MSLCLYDAHPWCNKKGHVLEMMTKNITKDASTLGLLLHGEIFKKKRIVTKITSKF
jgi:hypothetical protein